MFTTWVARDGSLLLGEDAERAGFRPGRAVDVVLLSSGSLLLVPNDRVERDVQGESLPEARTMRRAISAAGSRRR